MSGLPISPPFSLMKWQEVENKFLWVDWEMSRHIVIRSEEKMTHLGVTSAQSAGEVTLNVSNEIGELTRSPQRYLEPNLIETYGINLFALKQNQWARIRKPNPLHFVFLIWIKFYDTIKCPEYYTWDQGGYIPPSHSHTGTRGPQMK